MNFFLKALVSGFLIATISELSRRYTLFAALTASLPITSLIALCWVYKETRDVTRVAELSIGIAWMVLPSLILFISAAYFLRKTNLGFLSSMALTVSTMTASYFVYLQLLKALNIKF